MSNLNPNKISGIVIPAGDTPWPIVDGPSHPALETLIGDPQIFSLASGCRRVRLVSNGIGFALVDAETGQLIPAIQSANFSCKVGEFSQLTVTLTAKEIDVEGEFHPDPAPVPADDPDDLIVNITLKASAVTKLTCEKNQVLALKGNVASAEDMEMLQRIIHAATGVRPAVIALPVGETLESVSEVEMNAAGWFRKANEEGGAS